MILPLTANSPKLRRFFGDRKYTDLLMQSATYIHLSSRPILRYRRLKGALCVFLGIAVIAASGCRNFSEPISIVENTPTGLRGEMPNPLAVEMLDRWLVMDQVSDELDDYFKIYREERIRLVDNVLTEGWIETHPKIGATALEPWHEDSTPGFERLHATLQTVRRFAKVRVIPAGNSYQIDVRVYKELEDLPEPMNSSLRGIPLRHDNSLDIDVTAVASPPPKKSWIPMGRDFSLEQRILANIRGRLDKVLAAGPPPN